MNVLKEITQKKEFRSIVKICLICFFVEIFVFNFRYWESRLNHEIVDFSFTTGSGVVDQGDGIFSFTEGDKYFEFADIDQKLRTMHIEMEVLNGDVNEPIILYQSVRDESHELYYGIPDRQIWHSQEKSQYMTYHFYGNCKSIKITPVLNDGTQIRLSCTLNAKIPMFFSWVRMLVLWMVCVFIYLFRPSSFVYKIEFLQMKMGKSILLVLFFMFHLLCFGMLVRMNPFFQVEGPVNQQEYQKLAESLSQGKTYIMEEPSPSLTKMENPYDYALRSQVMSESGEGFLWDYAYFEGKYYVYFGVVPELLFYLPYYLLTGSHLYNYQVIFIGAVCMLLGIMGIVYQVIKRYFPQTSLGVWYLLTEIIVMGSGLIYMCKRPDMYTVPIIIGLGLGLLGVWSFLCIEKKDEHSLLFVTIGSLCMAMIAGCRPQLFLMVLLPVLFFHKYIFSIKNFKTSAGIKVSIAFFIPMFTIACLLMYYNYIRFGSVFDFGANYNLTFNDMRNRGLVLERIPLGIVAYLFAPIKLILDFPFTEANYFKTNYLGVTISEATYGGIFAVNLFAWMGPMLVFLRKKFAKNIIMACAFLCMAVGVIIIIIDTEMSGILMRYFNDFSIFFLFAASLAWLLFYQKAGGEVIRKCLLSFLVLCLILSMVYQGEIFFLDTGEALENLRRDLFIEVKYLIMFWL